MNLRGMSFIWLAVLVAALALVRLLAGAALARMAIRRGMVVRLDVGDGGVRFAAAPASSHHPQATTTTPSFGASNGRPPNSERSPGQT